MTLNAHRQECLWPPQGRTERRLVTRLSPDSGAVWIVADELDIETEIEVASVRLMEATSAGMIFDRCGMGA